jgi:fumarate hydratase class II
MARRRTRLERDSMGEVEVPARAYYGASTMRAVHNFPISGLRFPRAFIRALGLIKAAAAAVNGDLGLVPAEKARAIEEAALEVAAGHLDSEFVVDVFQTGSGTSVNMNANEVIANRAAELLGGRLGSRLAHPNDEVNLGQSSNDVVPTAIHLSALLLIREELEPALTRLEESLREKAREFWPVIKTGRTHLQDATPIRLGQEFRGYAGQVERGRRRLRAAASELEEVALGGTAVGTGLNTHPEFAGRVCERLNRATGLSLRETEEHFQAQAAIDAVVQASATLRSIAISLAKIADDVRWLGSGPRAGLGELELPEVQPGSSIMPGKVNPVIAEALVQACAQVIGNDAAVALAGQGGRFELNTMLPLAAHNLLQSIRLLAAAAENFRLRCVEGLRATDRGPALLERGLALATALVPAIGYDRAAEIAKEAAASGRAVREVAKERLDLPAEAIDRLLDPERLA